MRKKRVIFICSFNSVRSPIAEGFLQQRGNGQYTVFSAGVAPVRINPFAVRVMQEVKIDISDHKPASLYQYRNDNFDCVITLCDNVRTIAGEIFPDSDRFFHRNFVSPSEIGRTQDETIAEYRKLRDEIASWIIEIFPAAFPDQKSITVGDRIERGVIPLIAGSGQSKGT
ncbi:arsenate reductase ArsC [Methanoregula sp.]|uniref:arsenate reductase ArsC n=1 Tax=Methanoregula sp. TaxID=2052170 RepID=UPI003BAEB529